MIAQEEFDNLLNWLDTDRERAGKKYEVIRQALIKIFNYQGCSEAEDLADETINRVMRRLPAIANTYEGDPRLYFYGVGKNVLREYMRRSPEEMAFTLPEHQKIEALETEDVELRYDCMDKCLQTLKDWERRLLLQYYQDRKRAKIDARKLVAQELGISINSLRVNIYNLRKKLERCVIECMQTKSSNS